MTPSAGLVGKPVEILMVEDDPEDAELTREAFKEFKVRNVLHVVEDGDIAMNYLRREGAYADAPRPDIIILDLNLPRMDGRAVLREVKADPGLASIPVVVLTTSEDEKDVLSSYKLHANSYVHKPVDFDEFMRIVKSIEDFWLTVVKLPGEGG